MFMRVSVGCCFKEYVVYHGGYDCVYSYTSVGECVAFVINCGNGDSYNDDDINIIINSDAANYRNDVDGHINRGKRGGWIGEVFLGGVVIG